MANSDVVAMAQHAASVAAAAHAGMMSANTDNPTSIAHQPGLDGTSGSHLQTSPAGIEENVATLSHEAGQPPVDSQSIPTSSQPRQTPANTSVRPIPTPTNNAASVHTPSGEASTQNNSAAAIPLPSHASSAVPIHRENSLGPQAVANAPIATPLSRPNTPYISYANQAGLATQQRPTQPTSHEVVPTFHSEWAHIAPEETRPVREDLVQATQTRDHRTLVSSMLSGVHEWHPVPVNNMSYKYYVETDRDDVRPDLIRFKIMMIQYKETAHEAWSRFVESRQWFIIPPTLRCDRTFSRDSFDCYYLDAMDRAFARDEEPSSSECPLFQHDVLDRWWNAFSRKPDFLFELFVRITVRALVSYDSYETCHYTADELRQHFPGVPAWMIDLVIPAGIPLPLPPVAYYFPSDLMAGADPKRYRRAHLFLKREQMGLIIAFWYNEMMHGGRQWVVTPSSINTLREHCLELNIVQGVPTADILNMMMGRRVRDPTYWNTYKSGAAAIPDCKFVDCEPGSGDYSAWMTGGRVELADMKSRKVKLVLRQHRRVQVRRSSPLSSRLLLADLVRVPGLDNFVRDHNWLQVDNIRVHDLLSRLFSRTMRQSARIHELEREIRKATFERDGNRAALQASDRDLQNIRRDLENTRYELRGNRAALQASDRDLQNIRRDLENTRYELQTERRRNDYGTRAPVRYDREPNPPPLYRSANPPIAEARSPFLAPVNPYSQVDNIPRVPRRPPTYHKPYLQ